MKWELRFQRDGFSIEAALEKGRDLPDWYLDEPLVIPGDELYLKAFWQLNTCRYYAGGLIPHEKVLEYADKHGLSRNMTALLGHVLRSMDNAFIDWSNQEAERTRQQQKRDAARKKPRRFWKR